ncbi:MAG: peroxidase-related enzyme [Bradymonadaceae bacterium]
MSWIETIDETEASGALREVYDRIAGDRGKVSNIMRVQSLNPEAMEAHLELYKTIVYGNNGLSREDRELVATAVSVTNGCEYCTNHHAVALNAYWNDDERIDRLVDDLGAVDLTDRQRAMVDYAVELTDAPEAVDSGDIERLREAGVDDEQILAVALVVGYFNFVNRLAEGLGVAFSAEEMTGYEY